MYFTADLGVSTYDAVTLILTERKLGKFRYLRITTDVICVIAVSYTHLDVYKRQILFLVEWKKLRADDEVTE